MKRKHEEEEVTVMDSEEHVTIDDATEIGTLLEQYKASLGPQDVEIFKVLRTVKRKELEMMPLYGPKRAEKIAKGSTNPLYAHSGRANIILSSINDKMAFNTAIQHHEYMTSTPNPGGFYNLEFLLPALCHALDERNICDVNRVIDHGWVYFIMRGLSLQDDVLRKTSLLAFRRLIFNLEQAKLSKNQNVKIWLHFLHCVRRGIGQLGECKLSNLLSTWLVAATEVLTKPSHPMYGRLTNFLLARPILEMTIIPEFIPFYNASDGNKESREWILNILYWGLKTSEDWKIAQKLPTIKFMCSSFQLEKLKTRKNIVGILTRGARIPEVAHAMIDKYSLPLWIANIVTKDKVLKSHLSKLFSSLKYNCSSNPSLNQLLNFVTRKMELNDSLAAPLTEILDNDDVKKEEEEQNVEEEVVENIIIDNDPAT